MNGEQLCYMHGFVHRSLLYYWLQFPIIPLITRCTVYSAPLLLFIFDFRLQADFFLRSFTFGFRRKIEL